ncbi:MAG: peptide ABC transporter substrate-binding protein [Phycisphaerales bacterium]|jgi:oligopeptide transport system substrate-binding protein|nr:peptide ABC transporter substrate-binding protein [Phycisphaerales bacterium]
MARLILPLLVVLALLGALILIDPPEERADLVFINGNDVTTLDVTRMSWIPDMRAADLLFEGLVRNDVLSTGFDVIPAAAESWTISDDRTRYTFTLRADAKWSNGEPVRAADFVYAWRRGMLPDTVADYAAWFLLVRGGQAFFDWRTSALDQYAARPASERTQDAADALWAETLQRFDESVGLRARDDRTLEITLERPVPYFLDLIALPVFCPVYPALVSRYEIPAADTGRLELRQGWTKPPEIVGNGPMKLTRWRFKRDLRFEKNEHYWGRDTITLDTILMLSTEDPNAQVLAMNSGTADWLSDVTPPYRGDMLAERRAFHAEHAAEYERLVAEGLPQYEVDRLLPPDPRKHVQSVTVFGTYFWNFNCKPELPDGRENPFHDARVRRAFAMAIDKRSITEDIRRLGEQVATTLTPPGSIGGYQTPAGVAFDPAGARALLAEAGYGPDAKGGAREFPVIVELAFNKDSGHDLVAQAIARNWQEHLGVKTRLVQKELKVYREDLKNANYMTSRAGWYGDYGDPTTFLDLSYSTDGNNDRKFASPEIDRLLDAARAELDPDARTRILEEVERILMDEELPMVPIFHYAQLYMFDPERVTGVSAHARTRQLVAWFDVLGDGKGDDVPRSTHAPGEPTPYLPDAWKRAVHERSAPGTSPSLEPAS